MTHIDTDYLVVGAGAAGMAFADSLVTHSDAEVVVVDRRHRPGGHWNDAYPFVRLHSPSAYYGVNSLPLGADTIGEDGYERAGGTAIAAYYERVLDERLIPSGRVRFLGMHDYTSPDRLVSRLTGEVREVRARRAVVDATYLQADIPATHAPGFGVDPGIRLVPVNGLVEQAEPASGYTVIGGGKTAIDACLWLLDQGVDPDRVRWIRPRDSWLYDRAHLQPLDLVGSVLDGTARDLEALAGAGSIDELFDRLEDGGRLLRIDPQVTPTMFHCATVSRRELADLRRIRDVVRLGHVRHIGASTVTLDQGSIPGGPGHLYVDCSASGLRHAPPRPIFEPGRITPQLVRSCQATFNAALIGYVEATRDDDAEKNRLCPVNVYPDVPADWLRVTAVGAAAERAWAAEPDVRTWVENSRLNVARGVRDRADDPLVRDASRRHQQFAKAGWTRLRELLGSDR